MSNWQVFFSNYGSIIAGFFAAAGVVVGIISSVASSQMAEKSKTDLTRAVQVIERLETVIGDQWDALDTEQVETLRKAIVAMPFKGLVHVMYLNSLGKSFAQSIATAFRAAQWEVKYSTGGGFEVGVEYGRGAKSPEIMKALSSVINPGLLVGRGTDEPPADFFFVGVGSKPPKR
ncbi:hypothetical protein [Tardiphaga sp. 709]|uniref:hypothetical protein n=1 Tax=Tardiphaga sp. 709 TaxID=3076039 RepID=UPI0028E405A9|nr:hypothetical protein [Tardiphaga sp. 709]WNV10720.1 hypothetical protein RSO67_05900 [Tardiphaga sp. 709]